MDEMQAREFVERAVASAPLYQRMLAAMDDHLRVHVADGDNKELSAFKTFLNVPTTRGERRELGCPRWGFG